MFVATPGRFALAFGRAAWRGVEYSLDDDPRRHAIAVARNSGLTDDGDFLDTVREFTADLPFAAPWLWAIDRYATQVRPDAYLFRVDWQGEIPIAATLYCRFPVEPDAQDFAAAMQAAHPILWQGPDPKPIAVALGVAGPRGVGLRVIATGTCSAAVYFRAPEIRRAEARPVIGAITEALGLPDDLAEAIEEDLRGLSSTSGGVIGVGPDSDGSLTLKLNPPNVPVQQGLAFLAGRGVPAARIAAVRDLATSFRAASLSYLGVRYAASGFTGWRAYLSVEPARLPVPLQPRLSLERAYMPTLRLPHE